MISLRDPLFSWSPSPLLSFDIPTRHNASGWEILKPEHAIQVPLYFRFCLCGGFHGIFLLAFGCRVVPACLHTYAGLAERSVAFAFCGETRTCGFIVTVLI
jgi:hypothetical protein